MMRTLTLVMALSLMVCTLVRAAPPSPVDLGEIKGNEPLIRADGTIEHVYTQGEWGNQAVVRIISKDGGKTWTPPEKFLDLPKEGKWAGRYPVQMLDRNGNLHFFHLDFATPGMRTWHNKLPAGSKEFTPLKNIMANGPQTVPIQLKSGRIVVPIGYFLTDRAWDDPFGRSETTTYHSDDAGDTWQRSPDTLKVMCHTDYPGRHGGAFEPIVLELPDGRVWMVIRTQTGWLYESFSDDGIHWSQPVQTDFRSSDGPGAVVRLANNDIVLFWNSCDIPTPVDGRWIYTGRDALHAAISSDGGKTWRGYREVYLDPVRNETPPAKGDRGTAYPKAVTAPDGSIYLIAGQGAGRCRLFRIDPAWISYKSRSDDFSQGLNDWSVFKSYGPVTNFRRARIEGAQRVPHPSKEGAYALHLRRPDAKAGDGAAWNFPNGKSGKLTLRIMLKNGFGGGLITLTDRFIYPDDSHLGKVVFALPISADGNLGNGAKLEMDRWHALELSWKVEHAPPRGAWPGVCDVSIDGTQAITLPQLNRAKAGLSYLRLHATAPAIDTQGFLIEQVSSEVE